MDPVTMAAATVTALAPYLVEAAKGAGGKLGEAAAEGGAKLFRFLKNKLTGSEEQKALARVEQDPSADNQTVLRVVLKESLASDAAFRDELEALLGAMPKVAASQSATIVGDNDVVAQAAGSNISITVGDRK